MKGSGNAHPKKMTEIGVRGVEVEYDMDIKTIFLKSKL
jgi:hypothetical protein